MFGIGWGELVIIVLIMFLVAPKEIPKIMTKLARLVAGLRRMQSELQEAGREMKELADSPLPQHVQSSRHEDDGGDDHHGL